MKRNDQLSRPQGRADLRHPQRPLPLRLALLLALAGVASTAGMCPSSLPTGELGRAEFRWATCDYPMDSCAIGALAEFSSAKLVVANYHELPAFVVTSEAPALLEASWLPEEQLIEVRAHEAGTAKLLLTARDSGEVLDRLELKVRQVAEIQASFTGGQGLIDQSGIALYRGGEPVSIFYWPYDDQGDLLEGTGTLSVDWEPADAGISAELDREAGRLGERLLITTDAAADQVTVTIAAPAATLRFPVQRVTSEQLARLALLDAEETELQTLQLDYGNWASLQAIATLADGQRVVRPPVRWEIADPSCVEITSQLRAELVPLAAAGGGHCQTTVRAQLGSKSATVRVQIN